MLNVSAVFLCVAKMQPVIPSPDTGKGDLFNAGESAPLVLRLAEQDLALAVGEGLLLVDKVDQHLQPALDRGALLDRAEPALHVGIVGEDNALAFPVAQPREGRDVGDAVFAG